MIDRDFPWNLDFHKRLRWSEGWKKSKTYFPRVTNIIKSIAFSTAMLVSDPAYWDSVRHWQEPTIWDHIQWWEIRRRIRFEAYGVSNSEIKRYQWLLEDSDYEIIDWEGFIAFIKNFWEILWYLDKKGILMWYDINIAMNLYDASKTKGINSKEYINSYDDFLENFPNPDLDIIKILAKNGYPYGGI